MDLERNYWKTQLDIYNKLEYDKDKKYESWQPARWSANKSAIKLIDQYIKEDITSSIEIGAGSGAFSLELYRKYKNKIIEVDRSDIAHEYGIQIAKDMNIPIDYYIKDFFNITEKNIADIVVSLGVIEHYTDEEQINFIKKCKQLTNKYIFIAIPNQESEIFKNYVRWSNRNNNIYEEKHEELNINSLILKMEKQGLKVLCSDGFQVFLSEGRFWGEIDLKQTTIIKKLKNSLIQKNNEKGNKFPFCDFKYDDIQVLADVEFELTRSERINNSFMSFVLASK